MLEFRKQWFHLLSFPLEIGKSRSTSQFASALPGGLVDVDGEILVLARGALRLLRTRTATLAASAGGVGSIPDIQTDEVELLASWTEVAVVFGKIGEAVGTVSWVVLAESTVPSAHIRRASPLH